MKKAYIINLKYGIWENQLWLEADDNEVMQEKWEIAKAKLTDVATVSYTPLTLPTTPYV